ncbi:homoserine dehydrogenase [Pontibacter ruber]|uniref:Homoserine dehydrogenase n=1 Tax=Pontibacter ruber TaxID=1343895 RepID=A0ABW5CZJ9_9BACT|nr:homoserine dehydrogenase [Pontibacter ruber]
MKIQKFKKRVGIIGFGCVGQGLYDVVEANKHLGLEVGRICVKDKEKPRTLPVAAFTYNVQDLLHDKSLDILAELISDADEAFQIVREALRLGKTVVSANKKMIAENLPELVNQQQRHGGVLLYEASVCGSIPILRTLEAYYGAEPLLQVRGILNGSSNYILSKLYQEGSTYAAALGQAQALGFAEADPSLDVEGTDAANKLCILTAHAFGAFVHPSQVLYFGINSITPEAVELAKVLDCKIKLVASVKSIGSGQVSLQVLPALVPATDELYFVDAEFNGVEINAQFAGQQFLKGRGAGSHPTGSAVWADITAAFKGYHYTFPKLCVAKATAAASEAPLTLLLQGTKNSLATVLPQLHPAKLYLTEDGACGLARISYTSLQEQQKLVKQAGIFVVQLPASISENEVIAALEASKTVAAA